LTPLTISGANYLNLLDYPTSQRKIHSKPTPFLGGFIIFFVTSLIPFLIIKNQFVNLVILFGMFIFVLGIIDDIFDIPALAKLFFQILIVSFFIYKLPSIYWVNFFQIKIFNFLFTLFWIIFVINSINLIDGVDGLAAGLSFILFTSVLSVAIQNSYKDLILYCLIVSSALAAFLRFNIPPAKIFLGDSGSLYLGFIISAMSLLIYSKTVVSFSFLMPVLFLIIPLMDVIRVAFNRMKNKKSIFKADKEHIHHKLMDLGFTDRQVILLLYTLSCFISIITLKNYLINLKIIAISVIGIFYVSLLFIKILQPFNFKKKVKRLNYLIRRAIRKLVKGEIYTTKSKSLLIVNIVTIFSIVGIYILFYKAENWNLQKSLIFILIVLLMLANQMFNSKDDTVKIFSNFIVFWIYFYIIFRVNKEFFYLSNIIVMLLFILILFRTFIKKQFDLFIYNPLEILIIHVIIILLLSIKDVNLMLIIKIFIVYYSTKSFFIKENREYKIFLPITIILLSVGPFLNLLQNIK